LVIIVVDDLEYFSNDENWMNLEDEDDEEYNKVGNKKKAMKKHIMSL